MTVYRLSSRLVMWMQPLAAENAEDDHGDRQARFLSLTLAELEVCLGAIRGLDNAAIAAQRGSSVRTVAVLISRAFDKLGVRGRTELIATYGHLVPMERHGRHGAP